MSDAPPALSVRAVRTPIYRAGQDLGQFVRSHAGRLPERAILAVTSKIVSVAEGAVRSRAEVADKSELVRAESERWLGEPVPGVALTVAHGLLIPSAGIDESNAEGGAYVLFPRDPWASARRLRDSLRAAWGVNELGVLITDSHVTPLRKGTTGIALAYAGFRGVRRLEGKPDLFGRPLRMSTANHADALAASAVLLMGEADERCPLAVLERAPVEFTDEVDPGEIRIPPDEDLFRNWLRLETCPHHPHGNFETGTSKP